MPTDTVILRKWTGRIRTAQQVEYVDYIARTGLVDYAKTPGSLGFEMLLRDTYRVPVSDFCAKYFDDLWKEIEKWAADELRSVNGQIEYVLRQAVGRRKADRPKDE